MGCEEVLLCAFRCNIGRDEGILDRQRMREGVSMVGLFILAHNQPNQSPGHRDVDSGQMIRGLKTVTGLVLVFGEASSGRLTWQKSIARSYWRSGMGGAWKSDTG